MNKIDNTSSYPYRQRLETPRRIEPPSYTPPQDYFVSLAGRIMTKVEAKGSPQQKNTLVASRTSKSWQWKTHLSIAMVAAACMGFAFLIDHVISFQLEQDSPSNTPTPALAENEAYYADEAYDYLMLNDYLLCDYAEDAQ